MALKDENGSFQKHLSPNAVVPDAYPSHMIYPGIGNNMPPFIFLSFYIAWIAYQILEVFCFLVTSYVVKGDMDLF